MEGVPVSEPQEVDWSAIRNAPATISVQPRRLGERDLLRPPDGARRADLLRPADHPPPPLRDTPGRRRPRNQYLAGVQPLRRQRRRLGRHLVRRQRHPHRRPLAPLHPGRCAAEMAYWAVPFLHWLYRTGKEVDFLSDDDLERFRSAKTLARLYDLIVFPGHEEYVTTPHLRPDRRLSQPRRQSDLPVLDQPALEDQPPRQPAHPRRPVAHAQQTRTRVAGVQYRANDEGGHSGAYALTPYGRSSWQFAGVDQAALAKWHWFGIEFDMTAPASPPGTHVLAQVDPHLGNPAIRGQMTYYSRGGARSSPPVRSTSRAPSATHRFSSCSRTSGSVSPSHSRAADDPVFEQSWEPAPALGAALRVAPASLQGSHLILDGLVEGADVVPLPHHVRRHSGAFDGRPVLRSFAS